MTSPLRHLVAMLRMYACPAVSGVVKGISGYVKKEYTRLPGRAAGSLVPINGAAGAALVVHDVFDDDGVQWWTVRLNNQANADLRTKYFT